MVIDGGRDETAAFATALSSLKRHGSNLLLVGPAYEDAHLPASRRLLGSEEASVERSRLLVAVGREATWEDRPVADPTRAHLLEYGGLTRGATAVEGASATDPVLARTDPVREDGLATLGNEIAAEIAAIEGARDGLEPAELRICVDSLVPLVEDSDEERLFRFLHALTADVRRASAMAHYHLPVDPDAEVVRTLSPLFEAVVTLRVGPEGPEQRWRLTDAGVTTDWLPV